jgi:hypothetical protein
MKLKMPPILTNTKGGYRPGAGRPKGSGVGKYTKREKVQKTTPEHAQQLLLNGVTPLEVLITSMRVHYQRATVKDGKQLKIEEYDRESLRDASTFANMAAPYCHPRLSTHELSGKGGGAIPLEMSGVVTVYVPDNGRRNK